jgi:UDP-N-acetylglucosamine:LPS N-acetylglucosamine transferase
MLPHKLNSDKKILLISYGGGHVNMLIPIYYELFKKNYKVEFFALTTASSKLKSLNIPYRTFNDLLELPEDQQWIDLVHELKIPNSFTPIIPYAESIAYYAVGLKDLCSTLGHIDGLEKFKQLNRVAFLPTPTLQKFFNQEKFDLIVATNSPRAEKAAVYAARNLKIKSVCIVDTFDYEYLRGHLKEHDYANKLCVINQFAKDVLIENGRPANEIAVTGNPAFDTLFEKNRELAGKKYRSEQFPNCQTLVMLVKSAMAEDIEYQNQAIKALFEVCKMNKSIGVIIRNHPNDPSKISMSLDNFKQSFASEDHIHDLIWACDSVIHLYSTVGLESRLIGKNVYQLTETAIFCNFDLTQSFGAVGIKTIAEIPFNNPTELNRTFPKIAFANDDLTATERIAKVIVQLLK